MNEYKVVYLSEAYTPVSFGVNEIMYEGLDGKERKGLMLEGEFSEAGVINKNKRRYSEGLICRETRKLIDEIRDRGAIGSELDHPMPGESTEAVALAQKVTPIKTCGMIKHLEWKSPKVYGKMIVLDEGGEPGKQLAAMVRQAGWKPGISSRAVGGAPKMENGIAVVDEDVDFNMITYDIVSNPSSFNAILQRRINEDFAFYESLRGGGKKKGGGRSFSMYLSKRLGKE